MALQTLREATTLSQGPLTMLSVMVLVYVPAWAFAGMFSPHVIGMSIAPMPVVGAALTKEVGVHVVPAPVVPHSATGTVEPTESVGSVHVEAAAHTPSCPDDPRFLIHSVGVVLQVFFFLTTLSPAVGSVQGFVDEHLPVPVESVNGAAEAVRFQPVPEPVASIAVIVPWRCTMVSYPERVSDHLIVEGAPTASVPGATVAVPVMEQYKPS